MANLSEQDIRKQSENCYSQWCEQWRNHAKYLGERFTMKSMEELRDIGVGKAALCIANGYSFEKNIEIIKKNQQHVDIVACDKTVGHCLENDIIPKFVILCDANVSYEKYLEPYKDRLKDTILIANVCSNPKWATCGEWKDIFFFINQDVIKSEEEWAKLSGCRNLIIAGTNVSNAMVIVMTQCNNEGAKNFMGYDKILLIGFDYSWQNNYYAFDKDGGGKIHYMRNVYGKNHHGDLIFSSNNLVFSAKWFEQFVKTFKLNIVNCSKDGIICAKKTTDNLEKQMLYAYRPEDSQFLKNLVKMRGELKEKLAEAESKIKNINLDHYVAALSSL
jgi:hypothetical protein